MADTYLPADVRKRIIDVMRERKLTQRELALRIDVNESTISRFLSGKTEKLSEESVIRIARVFNVSTDFILGTTVIPDKKNYDISELGLSVEAAKNLYTGKVNNDVVNRLLENPRFATVTYMIAQHLDDTLAGGYAAQNQMFATVGSLLLGQNQTPEAVQAARTANAMKVPTYQADQTTIQNTFMTVVKEIKGSRQRFSRSKGNIADSRVQNPEQIYIAKETHEEIHTALQMIEAREKAYLWYRFGFADDILHPLNETADHFHLSESRAKSTEKLALDNFWLELPWWY